MELEVLLDAVDHALGIRRQPLRDRLSEVSEPAAPARDRSATPGEPLCHGPEEPNAEGDRRGFTSHVDGGAPMAGAPCRAFAERCEIYVFFTPGDRPLVV